MTMKTEPFLSGKWGWDLGENNWKDGADDNFLKFSYMLNGNVDGFVSSLPGSPTNGTAYFLTTDATLNARIDGVWYKFPTPKGFVVTEKATGAKYEFNGSAFVATFSATDKVKFNGIATGATVNASDAALRDRATHTGAQAISTITSLQTTLDTKAPIDSPTFTGTPTAPTVTGTDSSTKIATTAWVKSLGYATSSAVTSVAGRTGAVVLTKTDVGLTNVDNTADTAKPVSTVQQTALDLKVNVNNATLTGTVTLPSSTSIGTLTATELSYVHGVTSNIQGQIDSITGVTGGYAPINNPSFTGTVSGITKAMVGLGNVDNTSDTAKPVSTATQTALNAKQASLSGTGFVKSTAGTISYDTTAYAPLASPTFTGTVGLPSTTSIGSVTSTQLGYLVNTTSDIQSQLNNKSPLTTPTFINSITVNAASGQSSLYLQQAGTTNGRIYAGGGAGTDVIVEASRFVNLSPISALVVNVNGTQKLSVDSTSLNLGTGVNKITGDFTSAAGTRASVQTSVVNGLTSFNVIPNGTSQQSRFQARNNSDAINASLIEIYADPTSVGIVSNYNGTGINLPFNINVGGSNRLSIATNGVVSIGDGSGIANLNAANIGTGTLPDARLPSTMSGKTFNSRLVARFNAGATPTYQTGQLELNNASSGTPVALGFHAEGVSACSLVHLNGGLGLELYGVAFGSYSNLKLNDLNATGNVTSAGAVYAGATTGFLSSSYVVNGVTPIWRLANATAYGFSYYQGSAGDSGQDTIGYHFGAAGSVSSTAFRFKANGNFIATGNIDTVGSMNAGYFSGNGGGLTNLTYSQLSWTPVQQGGGIGQVTNKVYIGWSAGSKLKCTVDSTDLGAIALESNTISKTTPSQSTQVVNHTVAGTLTINLALGTDVQINVSANITGLAFSNAPSTTEAWSATLEFVVSGTRTITWPTGTRASGGTLPTLTTNGTDVFVIRKRATDNYIVFTSGKAIA